MSRIVVRCTLLALCGFLLVSLSSQANAKEIDPTGRFALALRAQGGGVPLASRGYLQITGPLDLKDIVLRHYSSPSMDQELGFFVHTWHERSASYPYPVERWRDIFLSPGVFWRTSLGDAAHVRSGGRINVGILDISKKQGLLGKTSKTYVAFSAESASSIEWFPSENFSLTVEFYLNYEFSADDLVNYGEDSINTGFHLMFTVLP